MNESTQLALKVQLPDDETFSSYKSTQNDAISKQLQAFVNRSEKDTPCFFYLFGLSGVGKSHLLHASSNYAALLGKSSVCLSCAEIMHLPIEVLDGLEQMDLICLDDIQLIAGDVLWQKAIFDLYNRVLEQNKCLLISGDQSASHLNINLPDLVSRLSWGLTEQLKPLDDAQKVVALQYRANQRGLVLTNEVVSFLLTRLTRDMSTLINTLDKLDKASILQQRKITIPFIKDVLNCH
jgi:DnaA family protein